MKKYVLILTALVMWLACNYSASAFYSNARYNWGFSKGRDGRPAEAGKKMDDMLRRHGAVYKGDITKKDIYLTFDNGYENGYTGQILDVLKKHQVPAAFFVTGHYLETASGLTKRMVNEGHIVGNHSWYHPDLTTNSDKEIAKELNSVRTETERLTGQKGMAYLRPPRGVFSERTMAVANQLGYKHIFWSLAFVDWNVDDQKGAQYSYIKVMSQIHPGAILLLHTISKDNADALESIIVDLKKQGYTFKSLDDLMISQELKDPMLF
ncbi:peptidoglycan-N-acetylmuramic acid deacetylase [Peribacillus deserti]|uniref:Peptidoglycan-N-acetylmuramic acid deacetylase n=1 Tax=Peribacillus deserti TaxID=673318 RepID=A0ABS2QL12_9BACI|nr:peptidoglycan-N-acetylmuramic acid deacetylase [Peribacillus deserti]